MKRKGIKEGCLLYDEKQHTEKSFSLDINQIGHKCCKKTLTKQPYEFLLKAKVFIIDLDICDGMGEEELTIQHPIDNTESSKPNGLLT
jgi:hypothetical protein